MNAHEAGIAASALEYPMGEDRDDAQLDEYMTKVEAIVSSFRDELEENYGAHLSMVEKERIWEEAAGEMRTWAETEEAYRELAAQELTNLPFN